MIQAEVEDSLSEELLAGRLRHGDRVVVDLEEDHLVFAPNKAAGSNRGGPDGGEATALETMTP